MALSFIVILLLTLIPICFKHVYFTPNGYLKLKHDSHDICLDNRLPNKKTFSHSVFFVTLHSVSFYTNTKQREDNERSNKCIISPVVSQKIAPKD